MLSKFVTWGDLREIHRSYLGSDVWVSVDYLMDKDLLRDGYFRHDDEFYFDLSPEEVAQARKERWPLAVQSNDYAEYSVTFDRGGSLLLFTVLINDERFYYRKAKRWIYIGPGDNILGFQGYATKKVSEQMVEVFDFFEESDFDLIEESISGLEVE